MRTFPSALVAAVAIIVVGCSASHISSSTSSSDASITSTASLAPSVSGGRHVPDGTYQTVVTRQEELAKHFAPRYITAMLGRDGQMPVTIKIVGGYWDLFDVLDDGSVDHGDGGTISYDAQRRLVLTSASSGCPGCVVTYDWNLAGSRLTLTFRTEVNDPAGDSRDVRIVTEHTYRKVG